METDLPSLTFHSFATVGVAELMLAAKLDTKYSALIDPKSIEIEKLTSALADRSVGNDTFRQRLWDVRGSAFDAKYGAYSWYEDARSVYPNWQDTFLGVMSRVTRCAFCKGPILVIGGGSANEAGQLWNRFGDRVTICEIGPRLARNCSMEAAQAKVLLQGAESLTLIENESYEIYCALRAYESCFFDINRALNEAQRVLRPAGHLVISVSNGYLTNDGKIVHGQIQGRGKLDLFAPWKKLTDIAAAANKRGFDQFCFFDLGSEIGFSALRSG